MSIFVFHDDLLICHSFNGDELSSVEVLKKNEIADNKSQTSGEKQQIFIDSSRFTLVPNFVFLAAQATHYFSINFGDLRANERIYFTLNSAFEIVTVFSIEKQIDQFRSTLTHSNTIDHFAQVVLKYLKIHVASGQPFLVITPQNIYFSLKEESKLNQLSVGTYDNEDDVIYFLLAQLNSLGLPSISSINCCQLNEVKHFIIKDFTVKSQRINQFKDLNFMHVSPQHLFSVL